MFAATRVKALTAGTTPAAKPEQRRPGTESVFTAEAAPLAHQHRLDFCFTLQTPLLLHSQAGARSVDGDI